MNGAGSLSASKPVATIRADVATSEKCKVEPTAGPTLQFRVAFSWSSARTNDVERQANASGSDAGPKRTVRFCRGENPPRLPGLTASAASIWTDWPPAVSGRTVGLNVPGQ